MERNIEAGKSLKDSRALKTNKGRDWSWCNYMRAISVSYNRPQICCNSPPLQKPEHTATDVRGRSCTLQRLACFPYPPRFAISPTRTLDRNVARTTVSCVCSLWHPQCMWEFDILHFEATTQKPQLCQDVPTISSLSSDKSLAVTILV